MCALIKPLLFERCAAGGFTYWADISSGSDAAVQICSVAQNTSLDVFYCNTMLSRTEVRP